MTPDRSAPSGPSLAIVGVGKMGQAIDELATARGWPVRARIGRGVSITPERLAGAEVALEFTVADAAMGNARALLAAGCAVVLGTTGWAEGLPALRAEVERVGGSLLWAPNFSIGAAALGVAARQAATALRGAAGFEAHILETHHRGKQDAPSGTARALASAVGEAFGRAVPTTSVRVGHAPGEHTVIFDAPFEQVRLMHVVRDRRVFAEGALAAAAWLVNRPGVHTLEDMLQGVATGDGQAVRSGGAD